MLKLFKRHKHNPRTVLRISPGMVGRVEITNSHQVVTCLDCGKWWVEDESLKS